MIQTKSKFVAMILRLQITLLALLLIVPPSWLASRIELLLSYATFWLMSFGLIDILLVRHPWVATVASLLFWLGSLVWQIAYVPGLWKLVEIQ